MAKRRYALGSAMEVADDEWLLCLQPQVGNRGFALFSRQLDGSYRAEAIGEETARQIYALVDKADAGDRDGAN